MKIFISNPKVILGAKGKKSMVLVIEDAGGQRVDLVFTSLGIACQFASHASPALNTLIQGDQGTTWPPAVADNPESHLRAAGLLETPLMDVREFLGARPIQTKKVTPNAKAKAKP